MKLTDKHYYNQEFKKTPFYNGGFVVWWTNKIFERCRFEGCDFTGVVARGCYFNDCVFKRGKLQHFYIGSTTLVLHRRTVYHHCTFERVKLSHFGTAHSLIVISKQPLLLPHLLIAILSERLPTVCSVVLNMIDIIMKIGSIIGFPIKVSYMMWILPKQVWSTLTFAVA